jgi:hypothetical protein
MLRNLPLRNPPFNKTNAAGEFVPRISVWLERIAAVPDGPLLGVRGDAEKFADWVRVADRGGQLDEPGVWGEVVGHGVGVWGVGDFVGEEKDLRGIENEAVGHVPGEEGLEGFGGVVVMPVAGAFPGEH